MVKQTNDSTEKCYFRENAANRPPQENNRPEGRNQVQQRNAQINSDGNIRAAVQTLEQKCHIFSPELHVTDRRQLKN